MPFMWMDFKNCVLSKKAMRRLRLVVDVVSVLSSSSTAIPESSLMYDNDVSFIIGPLVPSLGDSTRIGYVRKTPHTCDSSDGAMPISDKREATPVSRDVQYG